MKRKTGSERTAAEGDDALRPSLRFYHSQPLRQKTLAVLDAVESAADPTGPCEDLAAVVVELTQVGLEYYFLKPVQAAKAGFVAEQSVKLGVSSFLRVMGPLARRILGGMDASQLRVVSGHIRNLMR